MNSKYIKCYKCCGSGLVKTEYKVCPNCNGKKCIECNETGYLSQFWGECPRCIGYGIDIPIANTSLWDKQNSKPVQSVM